MTQHTKIYLDIAGNIIHVHTQTTPINFEPVEETNITESYDLELNDHQDGFIRARELLGNLEKSGANIRFKTGATRAMTIRSQKKRL